MRVGARLRARREALGWTLSEVSQRTRIAIVHIEALEVDRAMDLPPGPLAASYVATLEALYGLSPSATRSHAELTNPVVRAGLPLQFVRALAVVSVVMLFGALGAQIWRQPSLVPGLEQALTPLPSVADQHVHITALRSVRMTVEVDGDMVYNRLAAGGEKLEFSGHDSVVVLVPATDAVRIEYNGQSILPLGRRATPRTLVFADDSEPED